jgi:hypothetical protein
LRSFIKYVHLQSFFEGFDGFKSHESLTTKGKFSLPV